MNLKEFKPDAPRRILLIGDSGTGKTKFIGTMPKPYVADFDNGCATLAGLDIERDLFDDPDPANPKAWKNFKDLIEEWRKEPKRETFAVDSLTTGSDAALRYAMWKQGSPAQATVQIWGIAIDEVKKALGYISTLKCNVIVTAHMQIVRDEISGEVKYLPLVYGRDLPSRVALYFDEVYMSVCDVKNVQGKSKVEYKLQVQPDSRHPNIKSRLAPAGALDMFEPPDFAHLISKAASTIPFSKLGE